MKILVEKHDLEELLVEITYNQSSGIQKTREGLEKILNKQNDEKPKWAVVSADIKVHPAKKSGPIYTLDDLYCTVDTKILGAFDTVHDASAFLEVESEGKRGVFMVIEVKE